MRRMLTGLVALFAVIAATLIGTAGPAAADVTGPWVIQPYTNDHCLHPAGYSAAAGIVVEQKLCQNASNRNWNFHSISAGYYRISYRNGGLCFGVKDSVTTERAKVIMQTCGNPTLNDQWLPILNFGAKGVDFYQLKNRHSGKCLAVEANSLLEGADMMQFTCYTTSNNQAFTWNAP
ncbi:RICIN domain-containing protein [Actinoplanes sp. HUAS TT8]|uniref:RICIN domain-containing protein n=1 Tax=Actinoplanes sp. HUAS TT8 TaxID=3447453 RepID=UPI003F51E6EB